jgi:DNA modification methylase
MAKQLLGSIELNRIYQRDCIEGMRMIPDKSVNLIVIDPPYNIGKDARWDKWKTVDDYVAFMCEVFTECERVLVDNGSFYWFHNDMTQIRKLMDAVDSKTSFIFKQLITWNKIDPSFRNYGYVQQRLSIEMMRNYYNGFTEYCAYYTFDDDTGLSKIFADQNNFRGLRDYLNAEKEKSGMNWEDLRAVLGNGMASHYFTNGVQWTLPTESNYTKLQGTGYFTRSFESLRTEYEELRKEYEAQREDYEADRYPFNTARVKDNLRANSNVWLYPPAPNLGHITPKPLPLIENIIAHSSNVGDVVLDCFMGSGTTAVAAQTLGRNWIGFEREPTYIEIANKRLDSLPINEVGDVY